MILFDTNEKDFTTNGLGRLTDAIACTVTEERNGIYELALQYPITGRKYKELILGRVILAKHSDGADLQPFRIYKITKPLNGKVEVYAEHISYQLSKIPVMPFTANSVTAALDGLVANAAETCPFSVWTDKTTKATFKVDYPASFRSLLGGVQGSILDVYGGGEYEWDMWTVKLHGNRGKDSGVEIRYGKNLTELEATSDTSGVYTGVCPFWRGEDGDVVTLPEKVIHATTQFSYSLTIPLDLSGEFENKPTEAQLRAKAQSYLNSNNGWELNENIKISFVALWQTKEYKSVAPLQRLNLCDTATVIHDKLGVRCKAKVVKTIYNCLLNRYDEIELGEARTNLSDTVRESVAKRIKDEVPSKTYLREAIDRATRLIAGGLGGHLVIGTNANGEPNELLIMDTADKNTCVNCIRINANGIGFSTTGYNGTFRTAWTLDGHFVADFIDSGILSANVIKTGLLKDRTGKNFWNLETGEFQMSSETITVDGKEVATLDDINEAQRIAQSAIKSVKVEYSYSTSPTTAPTKNWSTKAPEWQSGRYIWQRTVTTTSTETLTSDPVCISGAKGDTGERGLQGLQGEKGDQGIQGATGARGATGKSTYFHIAYAKSADGVTGFSTTDPTDRDYIGTYVDTTAADSTDPSKYAWQLVKGAQGDKGEKGIAGKNGADGKTSYLHIAYATSADGKTGFSTTVSSAKTYIGQYVDFTELDSTDPTKYSWTLIKGDKGDRGLQGLQGEKGDQGIPGTAGVSTYFHIAYAKSADGKTGFSTSDSDGREYIGTYVDSTKTDSTDPSKYAWQLVKGAQGDKGEKGIAGKNGADGKTSYLHIAYATSADGKTGFSTTVSSAKTYIGQYVDFTEADSTDPTKYSWTLIKGDKGDRGLQGLQGEKGDQGIQGEKGATGKSSYFHIAYAKSADGQTGFSVSDPDGRDYIGTYVDTSKTDSTDPSKYSWQLVKGAQGEKGEKGIAGKNGADGKTSYLHIAYATSADGKTGFSTTVSTGKTHIGQYVDFTENDSTDPTKYSWTLIKGEKGDRGLQGIQGEKGEQGIQGAKGAAGVSTYFHIAYAKSADGKTGFSVSDPEGRDYIGTYVDSTKTDSTDYSKYTWQLVRGAQGAQGEKGIAGKNGADGKTSYLHIAYATSADGKTGFSTTVSTGKTYIGQYVDFTEKDSTDYTKYNWSLIKGEKGDRGLQGIQGEKGEQGIQGAAGVSTFFHIAYANSADGKTKFSVSDPSGRDYIGTYVDSNKTDSTDPTKYSWQLVKGAQGEQGEKGIAGKNGVDGKTSYLHIAYATSADGKSGFSTTVSTGKTYIGQYVDFTAADSTDYTKYSWTLIKGEKGERGLQGLQGEKGDQGIQGEKGDKGAAGVSTYFHIAYAKSADGKTGFSVGDPTDRDYIGTYVDSVKTDSTDPTKYAWQLVKGAQGIQGEKGIAGKNGADGKTSYLHIAYANSADGKTGFSTTVSTGKTYIGQYVDFTATDSTDPTKYSWTLIKGEKGERGLQGIQGEKGDQGIQGAKGATGAAGVSSYFHIAYAKSADGKTGFSVSDPTGRDYIGTYVDTTKTDSTDPTKYAWQLVKGAQGIQGEKGIAGKNGADGKTSYLHIAYANSADGKTGFSITDSTDKAYIGQYVDFTEADSTDYKKYTWSLIKGADGVSIVAVQNVYMISNNASGEVSNKAFNYLSDINAPTLAKVNGVADRYFSDKANEASCTTEWVKLTNPPEGLEYGARFTITEAKGKMRSVCWYGSNRAVPLVDGKTYTLSFYARVTSGKVRIHFRSGISAYPIYKTEDITASAWTRYSCTFKYNAAANKDLNGLGTRIYLGVTSTYIGTCEMCGFQLEEGSTVSALLPETPGWNALMAAPSATNRYLWQYEVITYSDGTSTETTPGIIGAYSADGRGVKSVTEYYALNNSTTAPADSEFTTAVKATTTSNKYLWNYEVMELTDGTKLTSKKHIISTHGATGATGNGIKSVTINYAVSTSNTSAPSSGWNTSVPSVAQGSYLWTRTVTTMTDGTSSTSYSVARQGEKGDTGATGVGVKSTAVTYQAGSSGTTIPTGTWVTSIPSVSQGQYLWTRTVITYTDSKTSTAYSVSRNGKDGTSVTMIDVEYAQSTSATTAPTSGWQTSAPAWVNGKYIWQRTVTKYSSGTTDTSKAVCITGEKGATGAKGDKGDTGAKGATGATGAKGDKGDTGAKGATGAKGDTGIGVKAITEQYYLSNSKTAQAGGSWVATAPAYKKDWYYWTRSKIDWTDGTTTYTAAVLASGVNSANEKVANMEVGGRNLILNSDFNKTTSGGIVTVSGDEIIFDSSAVGSTVSPYTVTLSLSAFAKTNLRGKKIIMSMDYKVDRAIAFGDTNPWVGAQLTLSRDTNTGGSTQSLNLLGNKTIPTAVTGKWVRVTATYNVTDYDLTGAVIKFWFRDAKGKVRFRHPKVEIGNVATDWTPAPEDAKAYTDAQIVITKADIKKTTDSISLEVSKKVGANEIISKINQTAESVTIKADKINFNGMITANKTFKIDTSGYMQATGGKVGGWKITSNSLENTETATYVKLNSGSFTAGTWSGQNIFAIGTKGSDGKVEVRWGVNQYGDMYAQTIKTESLTVNMGGTISGTMSFKGLAVFNGGVQLPNSDKTSISVQSNKVNIVHGGKSYTLINFIKGVANGSIT